jgi:hypothetical protein
LRRGGAVRVLAKGGDEVEGVFGVFVGVGGVKGGNEVRETRRTAGGVEGEGWWGKGRRAGTERGARRTTDAESEEGGRLALVLAFAGLGDGKRRRKLVCVRRVEGERERSLPPLRHRRALHRRRSDRRVAPPRLRVVVELNLRFDLEVARELLPDDLALLLGDVSSPRLV